MKNKVSFFYHLGFIVLLVFSAYFAELRATFYTGAEELFRVLQSDYPSIGLKTFLLILPITAVKWGASLSLVTSLYAISYPLWAYFVFIISHYAFRREHAGMVLLLSPFVGGHLFYLGNWDVYSCLCLIYLAYAALRYFTRKYPYSRIFAQGLLCILLVLLLLRIYTTSHESPFQPMMRADLYYSGMIDFFFKTLLKDYVLILLFLGYFFLLWMVRKDFFRMISVALIALLSLALFFRSGALSFQMEERLMPLMFFCLVLLEDDLFIFFEKSKLFRAFVFFLCLISVLGPLRKQDLFQERKDDLCLLLEKADALKNPKILLDQRLQNVEKYISPEYLHLETALLSQFHGYHTQSVFFYPSDDVENPTQKMLFDEKPFADIVLNPSYFPRWITSAFEKYDSSILPKELVKQAFCGAEIVGKRDTTYFYDEKNSGKIFLNALNRQQLNVYAGNYAVATTFEAAYAMTFSITELKKNDSIEISVMKKGADGHLVLTDRNKPAQIYLWEQYCSPPDANGWQELRLSTVISKNTKNIILYAWNNGKNNTTIYFDNLSVKVWRE